ncbi:class I SAM-dependent methyltransferase [Hanstruepera neustonica]|uniref:Class I SAM-dependent methyltransferase n=1 Tax=Hanstruepera neustonica TaxID=1445657 RepID=A0A2K1DVN6_9FLAO|nr:class I SAM-dependent methyltransferase [Hanstruepera neustonica]PNQ72106.1 class I SAM-dependent methyltransferase [Hanstruepera neustonica]
MGFKKHLKKIPFFKYYFAGKQFLENTYYRTGKKKTRAEISKRPLRTDIINFILSQCSGETHYLEIGVRNPKDNFVHIQADQKYSVDPGLEFEENPVDFAMTSDAFFEQLDAGSILPDTQFDVIFIDGLHLAEQVDLDIQHSLKYLKDDGFVVLHDCNPPSEWHARETFRFNHSPAEKYWNGTTWKAFMKWRFNPDVYSCCVDTDWGVGILSKTQAIGNPIAATNLFYEYHVFDQHRSAHLNLIDFEAFKRLF